NRIRPIHTRHEQGAAYLALGAAMATGKPSAYCVVPGPGFLNTTAALSQAYGNNAPVLAIAGQVPLAYVNRDTGYLHDIPHELSLPFPAGHKLWAEADVVLGIGSRLHSQLIGWGVDDALKIIRIEIDPEEMVRHRMRQTALLGDAADVTRRLLDRIPRHNRKRAALKEEIAGLKAETHAA